MRISEAKRLSPDLLVVPYLFDKYQVRQRDNLTVHSKPEEQTLAAVHFSPPPSIPPSSLSATSQEVSEQVYRILVRYSSCVQPLSCDEALMDVTGLTEDPARMASDIRAEIASVTGCAASAGGPGTDTKIGQDVVSRAV